MPKNAPTSQANPDSMDSSYNRARKLVRLETALIGFALAASMFKDALPLAIADFIIGIPALVFLGIVPIAFLRSIKAYRDREAPRNKRAWLLFASGFYFFFLVLMLAVFIKDIIRIVSLP